MLDCSRTDGSLFFSLYTTHFRYHWIDSILAEDIFPNRGVISYRCLWFRFCHALLSIIGVGMSLVLGLPYIFCLFDVVSALWLACSDWSFVRLWVTHLALMLIGIGVCITIMILLDRGS